MPDIDDMTTEEVRTAFRESIQSYIEAVSDVDREAAEYLEHGSFRDGSLDLTQDEQDLIDKMDDTIGYQPKQCYYNAQLTATEVDDVTYCEGYVLASPESIPIQHAWLEFPDTGHIAEITLADRLIHPEYITYFGKTFEASLVRETLTERGTASPLAGAQIEWEGPELMKLD